MTAGSSFSDRPGALSPEASDTTAGGGKNLSPALARALAKKAKASGQSPAPISPNSGPAPPGAMVNQSPRTPVSAAADQQNAHHGRAGPLDEDEDLEVCSTLHRTAAVCVKHRYSVRCELVLKVIYNSRSIAQGSVSASHVCINWCSFHCIVQ